MLYLCSFAIVIYIVMIVCGEPLQKIQLHTNHLSCMLSVYYQRFRIVLRLHSSDIAKDDNQKSKSKTITSFSAKNEIAN